MLQLLSKVSNFALARPSLVPLAAEEQRAIENFAGMVADTVKYEQENPDNHSVHGFCL